MSSENETKHVEHPNYVLIWGLLLAALVLSLAIGAITVPIVAVVMIFSIAVVKAALVVSYYMHLKFEPNYVVLIVGAGLVCLYVLFFGLVPDIVYAPQG